MNYLPLPLEPWVAVEDFNPAIFRHYPRLKRRRTKNGKKPDILDCVCAFDIEATNIPEIEQAVMYIWQFQIDEELTVFGRTWESFAKMMQEIVEVIPEDTQLVVFIHNLSYEYSYLKSIYHFKIEDVFAVQRRKVVRCTMYDKIEFRCSYKQTNMSLAEFTRKMKVKHRKLADYDYDIPMYPWTELTIEQLRYCQNDVLGLVEAIRAEMQQEGDNLITIPLTSTGYVRRECKKVMKDNLGYNYAKPFFPSPRLYHYMRKAFRGGDTHCNRWYCDTTLEDVHSYDRSSSYPDVICNCKFPMKPFVECTAELTESYLNELVFQRGRAILMEVRFTNVKLKNKYWGNPYFTKDKSYDISSDMVMFTGRIISASALTTIITDVDYRIIKNEYDYDMKVITWFKSTYGNLPECFTDFVKDWYRKKTSLKDLKGVTEEETEFNEKMYMKAKNMLNSIYLRNDSNRPDKRSNRILG